MTFLGLDQGTVSTPPSAGDAATRCCVKPNANQAGRSPCRGPKSVARAGTKTKSPELQITGESGGVILRSAKAQHLKDVAAADASFDVRSHWTPRIAPFLSHSECVEVMPRVAFMETMDQQALFEKSRIFFHLATLDHGTAPLFERLAVRYWMTAVALDEPAELRIVPLGEAPTERTAA
jgi:hypothetical protein